MGVLSPPSPNRQVPGAARRPRGEQPAQRQRRCLLHAEAHSPSPPSLSVMLLSVPPTTALFLAI